MVNESFLNFKELYYLHNIFVVSLDLLTVWWSHTNYDFDVSAGRRIAITISDVAFK